MMGIQFSVFDNFESVEEKWLLLEKESAIFVFQNFFWLKTWYDTIGKNEKIVPCIVLVSSNNENCAILPLCIKRLSFINCLTWMGGKVTDYHAPILNKNCDILFDFHELIIFLKKEAPHFDYILFEKQPETIMGINNPFIFKECKPNNSNAFSANLGHKWEDYYHKRISSKARYNNRRNIKLLNEHGEVNFYIAQNNDDRVEIVNEMIQHKINRYHATNVKNMFEEEHYKDFYFQLSNLHDLNNFKLHISALQVNGQIVSTHWGVYDNERFYYLMPTYLDNAFSKYSPGKLLQIELMRWSINHGLTIFDFTVGGEDYKHDWCDMELKLYKYTKSLTYKGLILKYINFFEEWLRSNKIFFYIVQKIRRRIRKIKVESNKILNKNS